MRSRITVSWSEIVEDAADDYLSSEDDYNDDEQNKDCPSVMDLSTDNIQEIADIGIYNFEISDTNYPEDESEDNSQSEFYGFKLAADNIDKNFRPSFQRQYHQTISVHHFHAYAVADHVNFS